MFIFSLGAFQVSKMEVGSVGYTIRDIASRAGVSKSTVSRVITGKGFASQEAREKVLKAIEELKYKPNGLARAMVSQKTNNIGVIIYRHQSSLRSDSIDETMIDSILKKAKDLRYSVFVTTDGEESLNAADFMLEKRVDGLILISSFRQKVIDYIDQFHVPCVVINGMIEKNNVFQMVIHDAKGGRYVADHLYQLGHRKIFVIIGSAEDKTHRMRFQGFSDRIHELGGHIEPENVWYSHSTSFDEGYQLLAKIWDQLVRKKPTAIFATDELLAMGAMKFLLEKGVQIPKDIAVVGFDGTDRSKMFHPSLTTVQVDKAKMGEDAVYHLDQLINKKDVKPTKIEYEPTLVVRESTNRP